MFRSFWAFLGEHQTKLIRVMHLHIALFVVLQILLSYGMRVNRAGIIPTQSALFFTWAHIVIGLMLLFLAPFFIWICFKQRGIRYYFPYLWLDFAQIKDDCLQLLHFRLPESTPKGLASVVQGLGLGALMLAVLSGTLWFILWLSDASMANEIKHLHKSLVIFIEIYVVGHGVMGVLHYLLWRKKTQQTDR